MTEPKVEKSQLDKFKDAARDLDADDSEERFDANLRRIGKAKPSKSTSRKQTDEKDGD